jgi:FlaA1/EpsC-like NDP-sugar epimerase
VLVVGAGEGGEFATWLLRRPDFRSLYTIVGIADDSPSKQGMRFNGIEVMGSTAEIPELVKRYDIGIIFYAISKISTADSQRILDTCKKTNLHIVMISDVFRTLHIQLMRELPRCERVCPYLIGADSQGEGANSELQNVNA